MEPPPVSASLMERLRFKVGVMVAAIALITVGFFIYVLYAAGVFEKSRKLVLITRNAEGITVGMPLVFSGLPIGKVSHISLTQTGDVAVQIAVPLRNAQWLREGSIFMSERPLVGAAKIKVYTGNLETPVLPDGSRQPLMTGDASAEIPDLIERIKQILTKIDAVFSADSRLNQMLLNLETLSRNLVGDTGALGGLLGSQERAKAFTTLADRAHSVLLSLEKAAGKTEHLIEHTDRRLSGPDGILTLVRESLYQIQGLLKEIQVLFRQTDTLLKDAQGIGKNLKASTVDLEKLRKEIDENLAKIDSLLETLSNTWPFDAPSEIRLP